MTSFSTVTVVYNDILHIIETMNSVLEQSYKQIEYILIDGGSTDGTKEKILEYISSCANITLTNQKSDQYYLEAAHRDYPTLTFKFLSEKDKGIYDAMNKGIALATNDWINFLNCGDRFYNNDVLGQIDSRNIQEHDVLYGDMQIVYIEQNTKTIKKTSRNLNHLYALFAYFGHPNCFVKTKVLKSNLFDLKYRLSADYDLIYRLYQKGYSFGFIDIIIATFFSGGASDKKAFQSIREALKIALSHNSHSPIVVMKIYFFYLFAILKKIIKLYFPSNISTFILKLIQKT